MTIGFKVGNIIDEVGNSDFLHSFFSTISYHLEPNGWGTKYPEIMNELYKGKLSAAHAQKALKDLDEIEEKLKAYGPEKVIWDIDNLQSKPPWGDKISETITDLSNYFVTSTGKQLIPMLKEVLQSAKEKQQDVVIENY